MERKTITISCAGKELHFETGKIARQANAAVMLRCGGTVVFSSACSSKEPLKDIDFLPFRVDYVEKFSAAGKTLGGFIKREGKPTERETLVCRLIDRPLRPMFPDGYYHDIQLLSYVFSYDGVNSPDVLAICAASAALCISDIPLSKPVGAVRVGKINGTFVVNPTIEEQKKSTLDLVLAGTYEAVLMIEGMSQFLTEEEVLEAIAYGHKAIQEICSGLSRWQQEVGKPKETSTIRVLDTSLVHEVEKRLLPILEEAATTNGKKARESLVAAKTKEIIEVLSTQADTDSQPARPIDVKLACEHVTSKFMRKIILEHNRRWDGRSTTDIRAIDVEQGLLPRAHGSSLFTRGETQSLAVCVLGGANMAQRFEDLEGEGNQRFYMQYHFPPFSVGEVGRVGAPGRREVGHGKLAERALLATLPNQDQFPYTIRLESNIMESNGSSSMASVCGGCLAMMDAGIPISRPVAGIAMGLILEEGKYAILSDILGAEDALGDMDFKVAGDATGITAFQMDIKVEGITIDIMRTALQQAKAGRIHILQKMLEACPKSKAELASHAPRIETVFVKPSKIGIVIGPGGKQIRSIVEQTGVEIDINDDGRINLSSANAENLQKAKDIIWGLTAEAEIGKVYSGKISSIVAFGMFVEILPGKEGLLHISEIDNVRIEDMFAYAKNRFNVGDAIDVVVLDINDRGQLKLSKKALLKQRTHESSSAN
jgi:polyribonucleotide nucleotidyltransferase